MGQQENAEPLVRCADFCWRKQARCMRVGSDLLSSDPTGDVAHRPYPDGTGSRRGSDEPDQHLVRGDGKGRARVGQGRHSGAVNGHWLPVGMGGALNADGAGH